MPWKRYDEISRKLKDGDEAIIETDSGNVHVRWDGNCFESIERSDSVQVPRLYFARSDFMVLRIPKQPKRKGP